MYTVVRRFVDRQDGDHVYRVGDVFPRKGVSVSDKRLEELSSDRNRRGIVLIVRDIPERGLSLATGDAEKIGAGVNPPLTQNARKTPRKRKEK